MPKISQRQESGKSPAAQCFRIWWDIVSSGAGGFDVETIGDAEVPDHVTQGTTRHAGNMHSVQLSRQVSVPLASHCMHACENAQCPAEARHPRELVVLLYCQS